MCVCVYIHTCTVVSGTQQDFRYNESVQTSALISLIGHEGSEESSYLVLNNHISELELECHVDFNQSKIVC
jgi:hypothetical protein